MAITAATGIDLERIRRWFKGPGSKPSKALTVLDSETIPMLRIAEAEGYWPKGVSRKVKAQLNKQVVAWKFGRANDRDRNKREENPRGMLDDVCDSRPNWWDSKISGSDFVHAMTFGQFERAPLLRGLADKLRPFCVDDVERAALETAAQWAEDFAPLAELVERLDATRPKPSYVVGKISPATFANVCSTMNLDLTSVEVPPMKMHRIEEMKDGKLVIRWHVEILWPEGTKHNQSKFAFGSKTGNNQCHACGHAILNAFNWCPLVARPRKGGAPVALWVGRDCARNLFSVQMEGEARFKR